MLPQQLRKFLRHHRPAEIEALHFIAGAVAQEILLFARFDTFGDDGEAEAFAHCDDRFGDGLVVAVLHDFANERAVDF